MVNFITMTLGHQHTSVYPGVLHTTCKFKQTDSCTEVATFTILCVKLLMTTTTVNKGRHDNADNVKKK